VTTSRFLKGFVPLLSGVFLLAAMPMTSAEDGERLVFAADRWCPANCDPDSEKPGYMVEIAKSVFEPLGFTVTYVEINWPRAKHYALRGDFAGVFAAWPEGEPDFIYPEEPLGISANGLFVLAEDDWTYEGYASFDGKSVGMIVDYEYGEAFENAVAKYGFPSRVGGDTALELNIRKLDLGRLDIVVEDVNVFRYTAQLIGLEDRFRLEAAVQPDEIFIGFSPARPDARKLAEDLDNGVRRLRASGDLGKILARYGLRDWK